MMISETSKSIVNVNNILHFFRSFAIISYFCMDERDNEYWNCRAEGLFLPPAAACTLHGAGLLRHGTDAPAHGRHHRRGRLHEPPLRRHDQRLAAPACLPLLRPPRHAQRGYQFFETGKYRVGIYNSSSGAGRTIQINYNNAQEIYKIRSIYNIKK